MRKRHSVRRNRFTHILTWALVTVLAVQSFLPSCAYALETGRIQRLAEAIATYRSGSAVAIDAGVTVRTSDKMSEGVASGELSTSAETPEEGSATSEVPEEGPATSEPAAEGEPATSAAPNDGAGADGDAGGLDDPAQDESTAAEDAAAIEGAEVLSDGEDDGTGKVLLADEAAVSNGIDGRDYEGQISIAINDTTYILIGNEQQLRAIGTGAQAHGRVYHYYGGLLPDFEMCYPGDADLSPGQKLNGAKYTDLKTEAGRFYCGQGADGKYDVNVTANPDLYYTADANYIIFRDINLNTQVAGEPEDGSWTPLMFSGRMFGADGSGQEQGYLGNLLSSLQDESTSVDTSTVAAPTISNVTVNQTGKMDSRAHSGIGFFGTVSSNVDTSDIGHSAGTAAVSNINLDHVSVTNASTETESTDTLISGLADVLGDLLGGVLSGLSGTLSGLFKLLDVLLGWFPGVGDLLGTILNGLNDVQVGALGGLGDVLKGILDLRKNDPTTFATGGVRRPHRGRRQREPLHGHGR